MALLLAWVCPSERNRGRPLCLEGRRRYSTSGSSILMETCPNDFDGWLMNRVWHMKFLAKDRRLTESGPWRFYSIQK